MTPKKIPSSVYWFVGALAFLAIGMAIFPLWIIQPFRHQSDTPLRIALFALRYGPRVVMVAFAGIAVLSALFWRRSRQSFFFVPCLLFAGLAGLLAKTNVYEKMFHPDVAPVFETAAKANLAGTDMVMTVTLNGQTHGYPVRAIAYHHVINDTLGGTPIVATY